MYNTVIKIIDADHGQRVKEYFKNKGVDVLDLAFTDTNYAPYYGYINGVFSNYTQAEVALNCATVIKLENKTTKEKIKITPPEGYEIDREKSTFEEIVFKKQTKKLPERWEDLEKIGGYFINDVASIRRACPHAPSEVYKNTVPKEEQAEAILALCQLLQLREAYGKKGRWSISMACNIIPFLTFESKEEMTHFKRNHINLLKQARMFL